MKIQTACVVPLLAGVALALEAANLGDKAPALAIAEYIKGKPVDVTDGKNIYVVEFWATWCPPCRTSIPHLTEMQKKFKDKGVVFIGISDEKPDVVKPFVEKMGEKMDYVVAIDKDDKTSEGYMKAFQIDGIPHAFIVDKKGQIVWNGHPMSELEETLQQILDGKFSVAKAKIKAEAQKTLEEFYELAAEGKDEARLKELAAKLEAADKEAGGLLPGGKKFDAAEVRRQARMGFLLNQYAEALIEDKDEAKAAKLGAQIKEVAPADFKLEEFRADMLLRKEFSDYYRLSARGGDADKLAQGAKNISEHQSKNAALLNELAWVLLTDQRLKRRDLPLAMKLAAAANDLSQGTNAAIVDTYARALFDSGKIEEAIVQQKKAIALCEDPANKANLEKTLKTYQEKQPKK